MIAFAPPEAVDPVIEMLKDDEADVRAAGAWALGQIGEHRPAEAVQALRAVLAQEKHPSVRGYAADSLPRLAKVSPAATDALIELLKRQEPAIRSAAARALRSTEISRRSRSWALAPVA